MVATIGELRRKTFEEPIPMVGPWLREQNLCMIHSWRGTGKTFFALGLAQAVASGSPFLKWFTQESHVFYFDCEMGERALMIRFNLLDASAKYPASHSSLRFLTYQHMGGFTWNLTEKANLDRLTALIEPCKLIIIDNLSAAVRPLKGEDFKTAYNRFRDWMLMIRTSGRSIVLIHHSGKEGKQRGISDIEDPLDVVIQLKRPEDWKPENGTQFDIIFEKGRELEALDQVTVPVDLVTENEKLVWRWGDSAIRQKPEEKKNWRKNNDEDLF